MLNYCRDGGLLALAAFAVLFLFPVNCDGPGGEVQWQMLTKLNYTYQIRLHDHLLLLVSVPWCGESRSLMRELAQAVASDEHRLGELKLMFLNKHEEKMLADALGANDGITFFYHRHSLSYKYSGRLRLQNILSSIHHAMSLSPDDLPFRSLNTPDELHQFLQSSDKLVLLLEFCGWTQRLLAKHIHSKNKPWMKYLGEDFNGMDNVGFNFQENDNKKVTDDDSLVCGMDSGFNEPNKLPMLTFWNATTDYGGYCTEYEFKNFEVFLKNFVVLSRQFLLPPERHKFAVVYEKSLLPLLNIEEPHPWLMAIHLAGFPNCYKLVKQTENLHTILQAQVSPVLELDDASHGVEAALHAEGPTILLFVDRSSESTKVRKESQRALNYFRDFVQETRMFNGMQKPRSLRPDSTTSKSNRASLNRFRHPRLNSFPLSQKIVLTDRMSVMIMKDGKQVTLENLAPNMQGSSVQEILNYALKSNELKLSSIAKSAGFQLLSQDFNIELVDGLPSKSGGQVNQLFKETPAESESSESNEKQTLITDASIQHAELNNPSYIEPIVIEDKDDLVENNSLDSEAEGGAKEREATETRFSEINEGQEEFYSFFFYFIDGHYTLLETLTGGLKVPSVVIIDPSSHKHYVLHEDLVNRSSLSTFVKDFVAGHLLPFIQSGVSVPALRAEQNPPFVNLDFHEKGSIPVVTSRTFAELVYGNTSDPKNSNNSWNKNVLVLFSNIWCGFCQRMELAVREVQHAVKVYKHAMRSSTSREGKWTNYAEEMPSKLPLIYKMDCTVNDCSFITQQQLQREIYPRLLLFPAGKKNNTISYEGDASVCGILNFLAVHGSDVRDVIIDKSVLHGLKAFKRAPRSRSFHHEVILKDGSHNALPEHDQIVAKPPFASHERSHLPVGCVLIATGKLLGIHPFDESRILLVKADEISGFQGLITNKPITWDSVELGQDLMLLKEAALFFGGPVVTRGMPLVALTNNSIQDISVEVLPNIHFIDQFAILGVIEEIRIGDRSLDDFRFFLGYSGWAWEQLFAEIERGDWNISQGNLELLGLP